MTSFITVMTKHGEELVNTDDIAGLRASKVFDGADKEVHGCIIQRRANSEYATWCLESKELVLSRLLSVGCNVVRSNTPR